LVAAAIVVVVVVGGGDSCGGIFLHMYTFKHTHTHIIIPIKL
jgi:hypothetical protein